ncbi:MAG TPA: hypothetical protein PKX78_01395 [Candidatus Woesebacteria bacterium]|jgi:hypothetical protein|nr:hypothetical protein [Candidatus Woesebacteria bacterium]
MSGKKTQAVTIKDDLVKIKPLELLTEAWEIFRPKWTKILSVLVVVFLIMIAGEKSLDLVSESSGEKSLITFAFEVIFVVVQAFISAGLVFSVLKMIRNQDFGWTDLFSQANRFLVYLYAAIKLSIMIVVGLILLIIPGLYISLKYWPVMYLIIDRNDLEVKEAFKLSAQMTEGIKWQILAVELVIGALNVGAAMLFWVGLIITIPMSYLAGAILYDKLLVRIKTK